VDTAQETLDVMEHILLCVLPVSTVPLQAESPPPTNIGGANRDEAVAMAAMAAAGVPGPSGSSPPSVARPGSALINAIEAGTLVVMDPQVRTVAFNAGNVHVMSTVFSIYG
jgi:hypothetical protein